jgi:hypothetical protein
MKKSVSFLSIATLAYAIFLLGCSTPMRNYLTVAATPAAPLTGTVVSTYAGKAQTPGLLDDVGTKARLRTPEGVAADSSGIVYVADYGNNVIRKIATDGTVSLFAGSPSGTPGYFDAQGTSALFYNPKSVAIDSLGYIWVGDGGNHQVRMIDTGGTVSTPTYDFTAAMASNGIGAFVDPHGIAADDLGNVYVGDFTDHAVLKLTWDGTHTTVLVSVLAAGFPGPRAVAAAMDGSGDVYLADSLSFCMYRITSTGGVSTVNDTGGNPVPINGFAVGVDTVGNVYGGDGNSILQVTPAGIVNLFAGQSTAAGYTDGEAANARFNGQTAYAFDTFGNMFVADFGNSTIRKISTVN